MPKYLHGGISSHLFNATNGFAGLLSSKKAKPEQSILTAWWKDYKKENGNPAAGPDARIGDQTQKNILTT